MNQVKQQDYTKDLVFYELNKKDGNIMQGGRVFVFLKGRKAEEKGYYYPFLDMNKFADKAVKIPEKAVRKRRPSLDWIRNYMYDPKKFRIVKQDLPQHANDTMYAIHDNGGVPFVVYVSKGNDRISIYRKPKMGYLHDEDWSQNFKDNLGFYTELIAEYTNPVNILIGQDIAHDPQDGNSIIVQISPRKYVYIGDNIYSFVTADKIDTYFSTIGNSDVPYPVALSRTNAYFMLDRVVLPRTTFKDLKSDEDFSDGYTEFYDLPKISVKPKFRNVKVIQKREW
jgi:hypothetical protein